MPERASPLLGEGGGQLLLGGREPSAPDLADLVVAVLVLQDGEVHLDLFALAELVLAVARHGVSFRSGRHRHCRRRGGGRGPAWGYGRQCGLGRHGASSWRWYRTRAWRGSTAGEPELMRHDGLDAEI